MNGVDLLKATRKLIEKPENWTQGVMARDKKGYQAYTFSTEACSFCLMGAMDKALYSVNGYDSTGVLATKEANTFLNHVLPSHYFGFAAGFNDSHSHDEVIAMLDKAIQYGEEKQKEHTL